MQTLADGARLDMMLKVAPAVGAAMCGDVASGLEAAKPGSCTVIATALVGVPGMEAKMLAAYMAPALPASLHWAATLPLASASAHIIWRLGWLLRLLTAAPLFAWQQAAQSGSPAGVYSAALKLFQNIDAELARVLTRYPEAAASGNPAAAAFGSPLHRAAALANNQWQLLQLVTQPVGEPTAAQRESVMRLAASAAARIHAAPALASNSCVVLSDLAGWILRGRLSFGQVAAQALAAASLEGLTAECDLAGAIMSGDAGALLGCPVTERTAPCQAAAELESPLPPPASIRVSAVSALAAGVCAYVHVVRAGTDHERLAPVLCRVHWQCLPPQLVAGAVFCVVSFYARGCCWLQGRVCRGGLKSKPAVPNK